MKNLIGKKWHEVSDEIKNEFNMEAVDGITGNSPKKTGECVIDLNDSLSIIGYFKITDEENVIIIEDDAVIYSPIA